MHACSYRLCAAIGAFRGSRQDGRTDNVGRLLLNETIQFTGENAVDQLPVIGGRPEEPVDGGGSYLEQDAVPVDFEQHPCEIEKVLREDADSRLRRAAVPRDEGDREAQDANHQVDNVLSQTVAVQ